MQAIAHAHANWRFVIFDEEEDKPRLLVRPPQVLEGDLLEPNENFPRPGSLNPTSRYRGKRKLTVLSLAQGRSCRQRCFTNLCHPGWARMSSPGKTHPYDSVKSFSDHALSSVLAGFPNFDRAEYLRYPRGAIRQLTAQLRDSNKTYPEMMRQMTGLDVGWLERAS